MHTAADSVDRVARGEAAPVVPTQETPPETTRGRGKGTRAASRRKDTPPPDADQLEDRAEAHLLALNKCVTRIDSMEGRLKALEEKEGKTEGSERSAPSPTRDEVIDVLVAQVDDLHRQVSTMAEALAQARAAAGTSRRKRYAHRLLEVW